jgi:Domain of unknown function (DUF4407)
VSMAQSLFLWAGGYTPRTLANESDEDREPIAKLGGAVLLAAVVAAANWGIAGHEYAGSAADSVRLGVAIAAASIGIAIVLVIDRTGLFYFDVTDRGTTVAALWIALRAGLVLCMSTLTAQVVIPVWLYSELQVHALKLRETSDTDRHASLASRFKLTEKQDTSASAAAELLRFEDQAKIVPVEVQRHLADARRCWSGYRNRRSQMLQARLSENEARTQLRPVASSCTRHQQAAVEAKRAYDSKMRALIEDADAKRIAADADLITTKATVTTRLDQARVVEQQGINARSAIVLRSLLETDSGARAKLAILVMFLTAMELLPLVTKMLAGKSTIGLRLATGRAIARIVQEERVAASRHDAAVAAAVGGAMTEAIVTACASPEIRRICVDMFGTKLRAFVPFEVTRAVLRDIETRQPDVNRAMRKFPRYAGAISQAWSQTVRETVELLKTGSLGATDSAPMQKSKDEQRGPLDWRPDSRAA